MSNSNRGLAGHRHGSSSPSSSKMGAPIDPWTNDPDSDSEEAPFLFRSSTDIIRRRRAFIDMEEFGISRFLERIAVDSEPGLTNTQLFLANEDLKPVEPARRTWKAWNFVAFWIADSFNINTWMISSANIIDGLSWWQSWLCVWIGYTIAACFVCTTGRIGARYHISFPVACRSSFGIWGSLWPVFNRAAMACVWYGVQAWIGGECVQIMIAAVWPSWSDYATDGPRNHFPAGSGTSTAAFVSFLLFSVGSLPFLWFPVHQIRHLFTVKAFCVPTAAIIFFVWAVVRANGLGPIVHQTGSMHGGALGWAMTKGVMSAIANFATLIVNDLDFARFAREPRDAFWSQLLTIPIGFAVTSFIGIIVSSSSSVIFGSAIWSPLTLLTKFLEEPGVSSGSRFGVFVIAAAFTLAQLGTNIAANSVSAGTDMTALLPRWLNIRRGSYICAFVGLVMCPWHLLSSTNKFTTYLSAYAVFLSSISGVMVSDYYWVRKGYLQTRDLYSALRSGPYYYNSGISWRAYTAYVAGILINIVGFAGAVGAVKVPAGATYLYNVAFFGGFIVSFVVYGLLCLIWPIAATSDVWMEIDEETTGRNNSLVYGLADDVSEQSSVHDGKRDTSKYMTVTL